MSTLLPFLVLFIIALAIGIFMGKMLFSAKSQSEKIFLEEKLNDFKEQSLVEKTTLEKQLQQILQEKENIRTEKEAINIQLTKKEVDFENLWQRNKEQKEEVEKLQEKFTKEFENLANKILDEKSSKFTEQNKENMKTSCPHCKIKFNCSKRKSKILTKKASIITRPCANKY